MKDELEIEGFYQSRAKEFIDTLFNKGYIREDVSRDGMKDIEDFLAYVIQSYCQSAAKVALLSKRVKEE